MILLLLVAGTLTQAQADSGRVAFKPNRPGRVESIQVALFNDRFDEAARLCSLLIQKESDSPMGYSMLAGAMMAEMTDRETDLYGDRFERLIDTTEALAKLQIDSSPAPEAAWNCFWLGNAYAYQALYEARFGSVYNAIQTGMKAREQFARGRELDSTNYNLLVGLGSYHYWKSAKAGILSWIGIFRNEKERGINELLLAKDSASLYSESAERALIWIWLNEKRFDSVITYSEQQHQRYPDGKAVLWPMAEAYGELNQWDKAIEVYLDLRDRLAAEPGNYFNLIECDYQLCTAYEEVARDDQAGAIANRVDKYFDQIPKEIRQKERRKLDYLKRRRMFVSEP